MRVFGVVLMVVVLLAASTGSAAAVQDGPSSQYWVRSGDTWTSTAVRLGVPMCRLVLANGHRRCSSVYRASAALMVGQTLEVPNAD